MELANYTPFELMLNQFEGKHITTQSWLRLVKWMSPSIMRGHSTSGYYHPLPNFQF
jgi:hypothetical protein